MIKHIRHDIDPLGRTFVRDDVEPLRLFPPTLTNSSVRCFFHGATILPLARVLAL